MDSRKTVMITGATSGIGMAFARAYGQQGHKLILCGRREERLEQLKNELNTDCQLFTCDLADEGQCRQLAAEISDINIDILINNAGFGLAGSFTETDLDREINMIKVNDIAQHILFKAALKQMVKKTAVPSSMSLPVPG